jgi:hypothetical protein
VTKKVFAVLTQDERIEFLGEFLAELKRWQSNVMMQHQRLPYLLEWGGKRKRPEFPSGEVSASGANIASWFMQRIWVQVVEFVGGGR